MLAALIQWSGIYALSTCGSLACSSSECFFSSRLMMMKTEKKRCVPIAYTKNIHEGWDKLMWSQQSDDVIFSKIVGFLVLQPLLSAFCAVVCCARAKACTFGFLLQLVTWNFLSMECGLTHIWKFLWLTDNVEMPSSKNKRVPSIDPLWSVAHEISIYLMVALWRLRINHDHWFVKRTVCSYRKKQACKCHPVLTCVLFACTALNFEPVQGRHTYDGKVPLTLTKSWAPSSLSLFSPPLLSPSLSCLPSLPLVLPLPSIPPFPPSLPPFFSIRSSSLQEIEKARKKIMEAEQEMKLHTMSSKTDFLTTVYIGNKEGESVGTTVQCLFFPGGHMICWYWYCPHSQITATTTVRDVVVKVVTQKGLPPANYALYLVLGDSESQRVLCFSECLLAALCSTGTDCFLCVRPNSFAETLQQYVSECLCVVVVDLLYHNQLTVAWYLDSVVAWKSPHSRMRAHPYFWPNFLYSVKMFSIEHPH